MEMVQGLKGVSDLPRRQVGHGRGCRLAQASAPMTMDGDGRRMSKQRRPSAGQEDEGRERQSPAQTQRCLYSLIERSNWPRRLR